MQTNKVCVFAVKVKSEKAITPRVPKIWTDENVIIPDTPTFSASPVRNGFALRVFVKADTKENLDYLISKIRKTVKIYSIDGFHVGI